MTAIGGRDFARDLNDDAFAPEHGSDGDSTWKRIVAGQLCEKILEQSGRTGDARRFSVSVAGREATATVPAGVERAVEERKRLVQQKLADIEKRYHVRIAREGDEVVKQSDAAGGKRQNGKMLHARAATMPELLGLERALGKSYTSLPGANQAPLRIAFTAEQTVSNNSFEALAHYFPAVKGEPLITFESKAATNPDRAEETFVHEFAHRGQQKLWGSLTEMPAEAKGKLGWEVAYKFEDDGSWDISERIMLKDGTGYCNARRPSEANSQWRWKPCQPGADVVDIEPDPGSASGFRPLLSSGQPLLAPQSKESLWVTDVRDRARVRPSSTYFIDPLEEHAEAMTNFRLGNSRRQQLLRESPVLYDIAKTDDQRDIDMTYPPANGQPQYIRLPDGQIAKNDASAQALVRDFEQTSNAHTAR